MAYLTELSDVDAARLCSEYGLVLHKMGALEGGSVNSNFFVETNGGRFFLRIYEEQGPAGALAELSLLGELVSAGVPTTSPLVRANGALISEHRGKPVGLYPWVEGEILCTQLARPERCFAVGSALAALHLATSSLSSLPASRFGVGKLRERLRTIEQTSASWAQVSAQLTERLGSCVAEGGRGLPEGIIHGDLFRDNVLWRQGEIAALIDFESASRGVFIYDLMVTLLAWCFTSSFEEARVRALLAGYQSRRPLSPQEICGLEGAGELAALRFVITRITDYSLRAKPGEPPLRDYRRFLKRAEELRSEPMRGWLRSAAQAAS